MKIDLNKIALYPVLLLSLLFLTNCSKDIEAFTGNIIGNVTDAETGAPLDKAIVTISPTGQSTQTTADGHYDFLDLQAQAYVVTASKSNYNTENKNIVVEIGKDNRLDFALRPSRPVLEINQETMDFGNDATSLTLNIKNKGFAKLNWQISEDITWLSCTPTSGELSPDASKGVVVNVDRTGLEVGQHSQTIAIVSDGGNAVVRVKVSVRGMTVNVSPQELDFGTTTSTLPLTLSGDNSVTYTLTPSNDWIIPNKTSGTFSKTENIIVAVNRTDHAEGQYEGNLSLRVGEHSKNIPVRMTILAKEAPTTTLLQVNNITSSSATFKGAIVSIGSSKVNNYGFCWGKTENPDILNSEYCNFGDCSNAVDMTYNASPLEANTTYFVRAYAENNEGISYSNQLKFTTEKPEQAPVVETGETVSIKSSEAEIKGKIVEVGDKKGILQYGHVWSRMPEPTINNQKTELGTTSATGPYISTLSGLEPNTAYHVRAYATNSIGTSYGEAITITTTPDIVTLTTTPASNIIHNSATVGGSISYLGGHTIVERGVCWSTDQNPTIKNSFTASTETTNRFSVRLEGLQELTQYHARAYVVTQTNDVYYGNNISFSTTHEIHLAQADETKISNIGTTSASFSSTILSDGDGNIADCGFCYARTPNPTVDNTKVSCGKRMGTFYANIKNLNENTTYYVRAYVVNEAGIAYGAESNFATLEILPPTLSAITINKVTHKSTSLQAEILSEGNGTISDCGFVYSINPNPGLTHHKVSCSTSLTMATRIDALLANTTYYVRAYATNEKGTTFSEEISFTTKEQPKGSSIDVNDGYETENDWDKNDNK
ncbi:MAG: carboxypeptidase regulatory-like domain-containing protein [Bacteroidaceae bacterium]|nr:carboxypeptidase regulatory-like domain-containing protein [Bacteroidaceae bacterium]